MQHRESLQLSSILGFWSLKPSQIEHQRPQGAQEGPRRVFQSLLGRSWRVPGPLLGTPAAAQRPFRTALGGPWERKSRSRAPRSTPKSGKSEQKRIQDRFRSQCRSRTTFEADFRLIFLRNRYQNRLANRWRTSKKSFVEAAIDQPSDVAEIIVLPQ